MLEVGLMYNNNSNDNNDCLLFLLGPRGLQRASRSTAASLTRSTTDACSSPTGRQRSAASWSTIASRDSNGTGHSRGPAERTATGPARNRSATNPFPSSSRGPISKKTGRRPSGGRGRLWVKRARRPSPPTSGCTSGLPLDSSSSLVFSSSESTITGSRERWPINLQHLTGTGMQMGPLVAYTDMPIQV